MDSLYEQLPKAGKKLARIPRFGRLIGLMKKPQLARLTSNAAVYWELFTYVSLQNPQETGLIDTGLNADGASQLGWHNPGNKPFDRKKNQQRHWQIRLALNILAAVAYEMMCGESGDGTSPPLEKVEQKTNDDETVESNENQTAKTPFDTEIFLQRVRDRLVRAGAYVGPGASLDPDMFMAHDWECLKHMNSAGLEHIVFSDTESRILFTDISVRNFLAAYWAARWSTPDDQNEFLNWYPHWAGRHDDDGFAVDENSDFWEFWNFVIEIRELKTVYATTPPFDSDCWYRIIAPAFDKNLQLDPLLPIRSTELMYRTRLRIKDTPAYRAFHSEFQTLLADTGNQSKVARSILFRDLTSREHLKLWLSRLGICSPPDQSQFVLLAAKGSKLPGDSAEFLMGWPDSDEDSFDCEKPQHKVTLEPFAISRLCVTNQQYELFDPIRKPHREFKDRVKETSLSRHPVVNVHWFDCWWFTQWIGGTEAKNETINTQLPTDAQWEYACRCGQTTRYTWGDESDGNAIESSNANFSSKLKRTVCVEGIEPESNIAYPPNPWGLHQMHGNVWEWCQDWYARYDKEDVADPQGPSNGSSRVLRGGGWFLSGGLLRSASRFLFRPSLRDGSDGFRLAAVPSSPAGEFEQAEA